MANEGDAVDASEYAAQGPWVATSAGVVKNLFEPNGSMRATLQDQVTPPIDLYFSQAVGVPTVLTNPTAINDYNITVDSLADISVGSFLGIFSGVTGEGRFYFGEVVSLPGGNVVTMDTPLDFAFMAGDPVISTTRDLNVDGSGTPEIFQISAGGSGLQVDIQGFVINMLDGTAMNDSLFGSLPKLARGLVLRRVDGTFRNIFNVKTNGELSLLAPDATYPDKVPAGKFAYRAPYQISGDDNHTVVIRLGPDEALQLIVQDNLVGIESIRALAHGHIVEP